jgi:DNA-binding CsgD family transcriptional regulator
MTKYPADAVWKKVAKLWGELAGHAVNNPDLAHQHLLRRLCELAGAQDASTVIMSKSAPHTARKPDPFLGWRPAQVICMVGGAQERTPPYGPNWGADVNDGLNAVMSLCRKSTARSHAVYLRRDLVGDAAWIDTPFSSLFHYYRIVDRLVVVFALSDEVEIWFCLDRSEPNDLFVVGDDEVLGAVLGGLGPLCLRLAMSYGVLSSHTLLTPRERETLLHLLDSKSEKDIALAMGLTPRSAHQNVVAVFRKLLVKSRAELMVMWMTSEFGQVDVSRELGIAESSVSDDSDDSVGLI